MDNTRREKILHKCDFCDYENSKKHYVKKHVKRVHFSVRPFKCDLCEFTSGDKLGFQVDDPTINLLLFSFHLTVASIFQIWYLSHAWEKAQNWGYQPRMESKVKTHAKDYPWNFRANLLAQYKFLKTKFSTSENRKWRHVIVQLTI